MAVQNDIQAFVNVFGVENFDVAIPLAMIPWKSDNERNAFISQLVDINNGKKIG